MRLKLDENLPASVATVAVDLGHDADTVISESLTGATDAAVLAASADAGRILLTLDRGFGDVRAYPPGQHAGIVVLRVDSSDSRNVLEAVRSFLSNDELGDFAGCIVVVRGHLVRIRRPEQPRGGSVVLELDVVTGGAIALHFGEPHQHRHLAVETTAVAG